MTASTAAPVDLPATSAGHRLRFTSLFHPGRAVSVPCNAQGQVVLDELTDRLRAAYLGARALVGKEYAFPTVELLLH